MYKSLLMFLIALFPLRSSIASSQNDARTELPEEIRSYYSNYNYLSSLEAGTGTPDSSKPSVEEIRKQLLQSSRQSRSVVKPDGKNGPYAHRTMGRVHNKLEIEKYKIQDDQVTLYVRSSPIKKNNSGIAIPVTRQVHKWVKQDGQWVKDMAMIQQL
ncbi:MAG: hypothetical protein ACLFVQ_02490 [Chitinispirillaceae bacterium]